MSDRSTTRDARACANCGATLAGRRREAVFCSASCRAEASRARRAATSAETPGEALEVTPAAGSAQRRTEAHRQEACGPPAVWWTRLPGTHGDLVVGPGGPQARIVGPFDWWADNGADAGCEDLAP